jgi:hypothetical protein
MSISVASSIAGVLVLIRRLHQEGAVNEEEKGQLKDAVISHNNQVFACFYVIVFGV